jgi:hypothetical protein
VCCERALKAPANGIHTGGGRGGGASGHRRHGGLWELAHLASSSDLAAGGFPPAGKLLTALCVVGRAASPLAARCAHDVLADHDLDIIHYISCSPRRPRPPVRSAGPWASWPWPPTTNSTKPQGTGLGLQGAARVCVCPTNAANQEPSGSGSSAARWSVVWPWPCGQATGKHARVLR